MKKINLAENMLRFKAKNLTTLDRLILEQDIQVDNTNDDVDDTELDSLEMELVNADETDPGPFDRLAKLLKRKGMNLSRYIRRLKRRLAKKKAHPSLNPVTLKRALQKFNRNLNIFKKHGVASDSLDLDDDSWQQL